VIKISMTTIIFGNNKPNEMYGSSLISDEKKCYIVVSYKGEVQDLWIDMPEKMIDNFIKLRSKGYTIKVFYDGDKYRT
jgi:hypothetical protein